MEKIQALVEKIKADLQDEKADEEMVQSLLPFFGKDPEFDGQVTEHLATLPHVKVAYLLQRMLQVSHQKKVQKIIKRALYRLKSKGIVIEEVPSKKERIDSPASTSRTTQRIRRRFRFYGSTLSLARHSSPRSRVEGHARSDQRYKRIDRILGRGDDPKGV